jgi:hypothetical protein
MMRPKAEWIEEGEDVFRRDIRTGSKFGRGITGPQFRIPPIRNT